MSIMERAGNRTESPPLLPRGHQTSTAGMTSHLRIGNECCKAQSGSTNNAKRAFSSNNGNLSNMTSCDDSSSLSRNGIRRGIGSTCCNNYSTTKRGAEKPPLHGRMSVSKGPMIRLLLGGYHGVSWGARFLTRLLFTGASMIGAIIYFIITESTNILTLGATGNVTHNLFWDRVLEEAMTPQALGLVHDEEEDVKDDLQESVMQSSGPIQKPHGRESALLQDRLHSHLPQGSCTKHGIECGCCDQAQEFSSLLRETSQQD